MSAYKTSGDRGRSYRAEENDMTYTTEQIREMLKKMMLGRTCDLAPTIITQLLDREDEIKRKIEEMYCDERKVRNFKEQEARSYDDKALVNAVLDDILALFN